MEHIYVITCIRTHYEMAMSHTTHFSRSCRWWNICYIVSIIISTFWVHLHYQDCTAVIAKHKLDEPKPGKILQKRGPFTLYLTLLTRWLVPPPHTIHLTNYSQQHSFRFRPWSCTSRYGYRRQPPFIITNANQTKLFYSGLHIVKELGTYFFSRKHALASFITLRNHTISRTSPPVNREIWCFIRSKDFTHMRAMLLCTGMLKYTTQLWSEAWQFSNKHVDTMPGL